MNLLARGSMTDKWDDIVVKCAPNSANYKGGIMLLGYHFYSVCPHVGTPTIGTANVCYVPNERLLGVGSFGEIINSLTREPELQESLTVNIAKAVHILAGAIGVIAVLDARHYCTKAGPDRQFSSMLRTIDSQGCVDDFVRSDFMGSIVLR